MSKPDLNTKTALVTGASRGFGRAAVRALHDRGAKVVGVARNVEQLESLQQELGDGFIPITGNACEPELAERLILKFAPDILVLNAGATPTASPLQDQTWETFSENWNVDTRHVFNWTKQALTVPLLPGSVVIALSSGAAIGGSPLSGGYAGAKAAVRFISQYAAGESHREVLGIRFTALLPQITPATDLGAAGIAAYAQREGDEIEAFISRFEPLLTPEFVGQVVVDLCIGDDRVEPDGLAFMLSGAGLRVLK
jgi:NAD(P)-dependent dehydrogenase (short-subunit alcohol dehydrogenase family)